MYPEFKYVLWNSDKIDKELNWTKDMKKIYNLENEKSKSNIARLLILYQYGGIFIDKNAIYLKKNNNDLTRIIEKYYKEKYFIFYLLKIL
jgi:mannosyltransferase OCH1-like enzyme